MPGLSRNLGYVLIAPPDMKIEITVIDDNCDEERAVATRIRELARQRRSLQAQGQEEGLLSDAEIAEQARGDVVSAKPVAHA